MREKEVEGEREEGEEVGGRGRRRVEGIDGKGVGGGGG